MSFRQNYQSMDESSLKRGNTMNGQKYFQDGFVKEGVREVASAQDKEAAFHHANMSRPVLPSGQPLYPSSLTHALDPSRSTQNQNSPGAPASSKPADTSHHQNQNIQKQCGINLNSHNTSGIINSQQNTTYTTTAENHVQTPDLQGHTNLNIGSSCQKKYNKTGKAKKKLRNRLVQSNEKIRRLLRPFVTHSTHNSSYYVGNSASLQMTPPMDMSLQRGGAGWAVQPQGQGQGQNGIVDPLLNPLGIQIDNFNHITQYCVSKSAQDFGRSVHLQQVERLVPCEQGEVATTPNKNRDDQKSVPNPGKSIQNEIANPRWPPNHGVNHHQMTRQYQNQQFTQWYQAHHRKNNISGICPMLLTYSHNICHSANQNTNNMNQGGYHSLHHNPPLTSRQALVLHRQTLLPLFSQYIVDVTRQDVGEMDAHRTFLVDFGLTIGPLISQACRPYGPILEPGQIVNSSERIPPFSSGEDSEIEIERCKDERVEEGGELGQKRNSSPDLQRSLEHQRHQVKIMRDKLQDQMDKMGPRKDHCIKRFIRLQDLQLITDDDRDLSTVQWRSKYPRPKTYIMIKNFENFQDQDDYKKVLIRLKVWLSTINDADQNDEDGDAEEGELDPQSPDLASQPAPESQLTLRSVFHPSSKLKQLIPNDMIFVRDGDKKCLLLSYVDFRMELMVYKFLQLSSNFQAGGGQQLYRVYDKRTLRNANGGSKWVGLILRNIPQSQNIIDDILHALNREKDKKQDGFIFQKIEREDVYPVQMIQNKICTVVEIKGGIIQAQQLSVTWNSYKANNEILKCHVHPYSCMKRHYNPNTGGYIHPYYRWVWSKNVGVRRGRDAGGGLQEGAERACQGQQQQKQQLHTSININDQLQADSSSEVYPNMIKKRELKYQQKQDNKKNHFN